MFRFFSNILCTSAPLPLCTSAPLHLYILVACNPGFPTFGCAATMSWPAPCKHTGHICRQRQFVVVVQHLYRHLSSFHRSGQLYLHHVLLILFNAYEHYCFILVSSPFRSLVLTCIYHQKYCCCKIVIQYTYKFRRITACLDCGYGLVFFALKCVKMQ